MLTGPTGAIIKKSLFDEVGGFSGKRFVGDNEMWLILAARQPVVKFQPSLYWWRKHELQEYKQGQSARGYYTMNYLTMKSILENGNCPLNEADSRHAIGLLNARQSRLILHLIIKRGRIKEGLEILKICSFSAFDLIRNAFCNTRPITG